MTIARLARIERSLMQRQFRAAVGIFELDRQQRQGAGAGAIDHLSQRRHAGERIGAEKHQRYAIGLEDAQRLR